MEAINWDAVAALSEAFGVIAVVTSLIFVGLQIRQSADASKVEAARNISAEWRSVYQGTAANRQVAEVLHRGSTDYESLDVVDFMQFNAVMHQIFHAAASTYYQYEHGMLDEETFEGICRQLRQICGVPGIRDYWGSRKEIFPARFQTYIDKEIIPQASDELHRQYSDRKNESEGPDS
jgi:hypothetical protein